MQIEHWWYTLPLRLRSIFRRRRADAELREELRAHFDRLVEENVARGMPPAEARAAARRQMGSVAYYVDGCQDERRVRVIDELRQDASYAARVLRSNPTFTIVAVLTLGLGVAVNATMFSVVNAVALQPLPFANADRLVRVLSTKDGAPLSGPSWVDLRDIAQTSRSFERLAAYDEWRKNVSGLGSSTMPEQRIVGLVSKEYFETLGVRPIRGRLFTDDETREGNNYVAAIGERLWRDRFGAAENVLGRTIRINDEPYTIVAVMPDVIPAWMELRQTGISIWTPFAKTTATSLEQIRGGDANQPNIGRLRPGVSLEQARADVAGMAHRLAAEHVADRGYGATVAPLADARSGPLARVLVILVCAVAFVLMIACANLANLLLARNAVRQRELTLRAALGASRGRIARQLLVETMVLSLFGGLVGLALSFAGCAVVIRCHPDGWPQLAGVGIDARVFAFAAIVSLLAGVAFGAGPAIATSRVDLATRLRSGGRSVAGDRSGGRARSALVVTQAALALVLVASTAILVQSVSHLEHQDLGFRLDHALKAHIYLPPVRYRDANELTRFSDNLGAALRATPGVRMASVTTGYPPTGARWVQPVSIDGVTNPVSEPTAYLGISDEWFLRTLGVPILHGRDLSAADAGDAPPVAIVNETFERRFFPGATAVGRQVRLGQGQRNNEPPRAITIVGVFRDVKNDGLSKAPQPQVVGLNRQLPEFNIEFKDILLRTAGDPLTTVRDVQESLHKLDPEMPLAEVATLQDVVSSATGGLTYTAGLLGAFALLGALLAAVGIYGVIAYRVTQRRNEFGVRMAIGATPGAILALVLRDGVRLGALGAAIGCIGSIAAGRVIGREAFGVSPVDPLTLGGTAAILVLVAAIASFIPALRAARMDPVRILKG
jgi:predicted permease